MAVFTPAQIAKAAKNPGERSKIPDAQLKKYFPALYQKRVQNRADATLYNPMAPLSGPTLRSSASALTDAELKPKLAP